MIRKTTRLTRLVAAIGLATGIVFAGSVTPASGAGEPDHTAPVSEFADYWDAVKFDDSSEDTKAKTAFRGDVTDAGKDILKSNDDTLVKINHKAAKDTSQSHRALIDADDDWKQTIPDALGPVLGKYFSEGVAADKLPKTSAAFEGVSKSTGSAKTTYNYPRPYLDDRSFDGENDLNGLDKNLDISTVPDWTDPDTGKSHTAKYQGLLDNYSQAFPSGHTTYAYGVGIEMAMLLPALGPEALTRASEAGNNRIALGVHYPLDVLGGRIEGHANASYVYSDEDYVEDTLEPAHQELVDYLTKECSADGHGDTLAKCITETKANDGGGYTNDFTDPIATNPVTDRASALKVYKQRMTYGFGKVNSKSGGSADAGGSVDADDLPADSENLLVTTFPELDAEQRSQVLAATARDSGFALDSSSDGWQRINLPAAMSSKVTLDRDGNVTKVDPGQPKPEVVDAAK